MLFSQSVSSQSMRRFWGSIYRKSITETRRHGGTERRKLFTAEARRRGERHRQGHGNLGDGWFMRNGIWHWVELPKAAWVAEVFPGSFGTSRASVQRLRMTKAKFHLSLERVPAHQGNRA